MTQLTLTIPQVGSPNSTEDPKISTALTLIQAWANGNIDTTNIKTAVQSGLLADRPAPGAVAPGAFYYATDTVLLYWNTGSGWATIASPTGSTSQAPGMVALYAGSADPQDSDAVIRWNICDGRTLSRTTNAALFANIGTTFGSGDGSTTFNIPDCRGRAGVGVGSNTGDNGQFGIVALGQKLGRWNHALVETEMAVHNHSTVASGGFVASSTSAWGATQATGSTINGILFTNGGITGTNQVTSTAGSGFGHINYQPSLGLNYIIKIV